MKPWVTAGRRAARGARRTAALAVLVGAALAGCGASAGGRAPRAQVIEIEGFTFRPQTLRIAVGDTVVWVNRDVVPHTATHGSGAWDSGSLQDGASWRYVAEVAGTSRYLCTLHPTMTGTLIVE